MSHMTTSALSSHRNIEDAWYERVGEELEMANNSKNGQRYQEQPLTQKSAPSWDHRSGNTNSNVKHSVGVSKWAIGWKVPASIVASYLFGVAIAIAHLNFFLYLNGKRVEELHIPQTYVTTASTILANSFGISVQVGLAAAFAQYLWRLLRRAPLDLSLLERLFTLRSNPFSFLHRHIYRSYFALATMALVIWLCPIVTSFPPGALKISSRPHEKFGFGTIPTLDLSNIGNGSEVDIQRYSLFEYFPLELANGTTVVDLNFLGGSGNYWATQSIASKTMLNMNMDTIRSPCGTNCSYSDSFDGPYLDCSETTTDIIDLSVSSSMTAYEARWPEQDTDTDTLFAAWATKEPIVFETFNLTTCYNNYTGNNPGDSALNATKITLSCLPSRATYHVDYLFDQTGTQDIKIQTRDIVPLANLSTPLRFDNYSGNLITNPERSMIASYIRDANIAMLIFSMVAPLVGSTESATFCPATNNSLEYTTGSWYPNFSGALFVDKEETLNESIVPYTRFSVISPYTDNNTAFENDTHIASNLFNVTQDGLNSLLQNITLAYMMTLSPFSAQVQQKQTVFVNIYEFSHSLNLLLPYFIILGVALPFLLLGLVSLYSNGVPATDGGFLQVLTTTRGSNTLDRLAARACLGGELNFPEELTRTKVMFGEFREKSTEEHEKVAPGYDAQRDRDLRASVRTGMDDDEHEREPSQSQSQIQSQMHSGSIRRAGFGTEDEVVPLVKGRLYGG